MTEIYTPDSVPVSQGVPEKKTSDEVQSPDTTTSLKRPREEEEEEEHEQKEKKNNQEADQEEKQDEEQEDNEQEDNEQEDNEQEDDEQEDNEQEDDEQEDDEQEDDEQEDEIKIGPHSLDVSPESSLSKMLQEAINSDQNKSLTLSERYRLKSKLKRITANADARAFDNTVALEKYSLAFELAKTKFVLQDELLGGVARYHDFVVEYFNQKIEELGKVADEVNRVVKLLDN